MYRWPRHLRLLCYQWWLNLCYLTRESHSQLCVDAQADYHGERDAATLRQREHVLRRCELGGPTLGGSRAPKVEMIWGRKTREIRKNLSKKRTRALVHRMRNTAIYGYRTYHGCYRQLPTLTVLAVASHTTAPLSPLGAAELCTDAARHLLHPR